jgi:hypothetical protein
MNQVFEILSQVAPIIIMLGIGFLFKKNNIFPPDTVEGLKKVVFYVTLPVVLFGAFYNVKYNFSVFICFITIYIYCALAMILGFIIKKFFHLKQNMFPFLLTAFEAGMLGYALFSIAYGAENISKFATVDLGQTVFVYTIMMTTLYFQTSGKDGIKMTLKNMSSTPAFWGVFVGIIIGISGLGMLINSSSAGPMVSNIIKFIGGPTGALILLIVGYELEFSALNIQGAIITIISRLVIVLPLGFATWAIISKLTNSTDILLRSALMILFILPAPFVIPLFVDSPNEKEYIATTLSLNILVTLILYIVVISIF